MLDSQGLHLRAAFFRFIRSFFHQHGFLEVDTPIRQPVYIPESNITPIASELEFLQTSPELCMKRMLAAGCSKIFQICHCFRKAEKGRLHLEEFRMLEWYRTGADYHRLMVDCELLLRFLVDSLQQLPGDGGAETPAFFAGIDLNRSWERLTVADAFARYSPVGLEPAQKNGMFEEVLVEYIEPRLGLAGPVILYDYPVALGSLAKSRDDDPAVVERFELYIRGVELANGFSELTDAGEQRLRFKQEIEAIKASSGREAVIPERFLADLQQLESAAGIAMGVDRLLMLALNRQQISEVVTFAPEDL